MEWKLSRFRPGFVILCAALLGLPGCHEEEPIRHYLAPKESLPEPPAMRMLAVMVPREKDVWFFKFLGAKKDVSDHEADFNAFLSTVHFQDKDEAFLTWTNPPGWRRQTGPRPRYATLRLGPKGEGLEITITKFGPESADVRDNVNRWRGQMGLPDLTDDEYRALYNNTTVDGIKATRVDLVGVVKQEAAPSRRPKKEAVPFTYTAPEGWEAQPAVEKRGVRIPVVLRVGGKDGEAEAAAMPLPGDGGGLEFNVNRWRQQVGLPAGSAEQIRRDARTLKVGETEAVYVDVAGPGAGAPRRILGAAVPHGGETWFFTLKGPPDLVGKEQAHFESFVKSVRFDRQAGAAHE